MPSSSIATGPHDWSSPPRSVKPVVLTQPSPVVNPVLDLLRNAEQQLREVDYHAHGKLDAVECSRLARARSDVAKAIAELAAPA